MEFNSPVVLSAVNATLYTCTTAWTNPLALAPYLSLYPSDISSPFITSVIYTLAVVYLCWFLSLITGTYSWTDRLWSITPVLFAYIFAAKDLHKLYTGAPDIEYRLVVLFVIILIWGLRLTYNFYRKGGYEWKSQDYRWTYLQEKVPFVFFQFFNLIFIAFYQNVLLFLITLPLYFIYFYRAQIPLTWIDYTALSFAFLFIIGETIADQQQWVFHQEKQKRITKRQPIRNHFLNTGLWRYSRHPNFFCEQMLWIMVYLSTLTISMAKERSYINLSIVGCVLLVSLFQGSTTFTEFLTLQKYPDYKQYQLTTSRLIPFFSEARKPHRN